MPGNLFAADVLFPHLTEKQNTDEKISVVTDYLYMLLEQLRYTLGNLGEENFNEKELDNIGKTITEPVYIALRGVEGEFASISATTEGLVSRVSGAEGAITTLTQTSDAISLRVEGVEGNVTSLSATVNGLNSTVGSLNGKYTSLAQTVGGLTLTASNGSSSSVIALKSGSVTISSTEVMITGMVTFASLAGSGQSIINGDNIKTGTITAVTLSGCTFKTISDTVGNIYGGMELYCRDLVGTEHLVGSFRTDVLNNQCRVYLQSRQPAYLNLETVLKIYSETRLSLEADDSVYLQGPTIYLNGTVYLNGRLLQ